MLVCRAMREGDEARLEAFLEPRTAEAYYLRSNALRGGLSYAGKPAQAEYVGAFDSAGELTGVAGYSWMNTILLAGSVESMGPLACALRPLLRARGGRLEAILGLRPLVSAFREALPVPASALRFDADDFLFSASRAALRRPPARGRVRLATAADAPLLTNWRLSFYVEASGALRTPEKLAEVEAEILRRVQEQDLFLLEGPEGQGPLAFCGLGGAVPDTVMLGPVWTPPEGRGRGFAKAVVAGAIDLLALSRREIRTVVLFASRPDAIHVYETLGFEKIGAWGLPLFRADYRWAAVNDSKDG